MINFKERLQKLISERGCTQLSLAQFVGVKPNTVSDWLKKGTSPKIEHLYRIADFFDISFDYLFTGKEYSKNKLNDEIFENSFSEDEKELISYFRKLSSKEKYMELGRLQTLIEKSSTQKNAI